MSLSLHPIAARVEWRIPFLSAAVKYLPNSRQLAVASKEGSKDRGHKLECSPTMSFRRQGLGVPFVPHPPGHLGL